jgi:HK97 family phage major capsid protein
MKLLDQLVSERADVAETMTGILDTAAEETRDLTESEETNISELHGQAEKLDTRITELRDIQVANLEAAKLRAEVTHGDDDDDDDAGDENALRVRVKEEALTYAQEASTSFFRDIYNSQMNHDPQAQARISRHSDEMKVEYRDGSTTNYAGLVVPQYLTELAAELARAGRPFANLCTALPLPNDGMTINISRVTTGATAAAQATENSAVSEQDIDDTLMSLDIRTISGQQDISRQALDRGTGIDALIMADLSGAIATSLDDGMINGAGTSGTLLGLKNITGINAVTYTDASPTVAELYPKLLDAIQKINSNRYAGPDLIVMHPRRAAWMAAAVDGQSRPLVLPQANVPSNAMGTGPVAGYGSTGLQVAGIPIVTDANIQTDAGSGNNEDNIFVVRRADMLLFESPGAPSMVRMDQTLGGNLTVKMVAWQYACFIGGRYPAAISMISGTGLVAPSF